MSVLGVGGVFALPYSMAYLGWAGGLILYATTAASSYYSGSLLIQCQDATRHSTYSALADDIMGDGWSRRWVRPFQGIVLATVLISTVIGLGHLMALVDLQIDGRQNLPNSAWMAISGLVLFVISLAPDIETSWSVSLVGAISTLVAIVMLLVGCGVSIGRTNPDDVSYGRPPDVSRQEYAVGVLESFGILAFAFGGHSVLPDIHHSLGNNGRRQAQEAMAKAWQYSYYVIAPSYLLVLCLSYVAFGSSATAFLIDDIAPYVSQQFLWPLYAFSIANLFALGAIYNQAAFTFIEDMLMMLGKMKGQGRDRGRWWQCCGLTKEEHKQGLFVGPTGRKHWHKKFTIRFLYVGLGTLIAAAFPFFGDILALSGAIGITPCTFIYPFWIYNSSDNGRRASAWRASLHWALGGLFAALGIGAAVGSVYSIIWNSSSFTFFG